VRHHPTMKDIEGADMPRQIIANGGQLTIQVRRIALQQAQMAAQRTARVIAHFQFVVDAVVGLGISTHHVLGQPVAKSLSILFADLPVRSGEIRMIRLDRRNPSMKEPIDIWLLSRVPWKILQPPEVFEQLPSRTAQRQSAPPAAAILLQLNEAMFSEHIE
jgi:hypothetical protein